MTIDDAIKAVINDCKDPYAQTYARAAMTAAVQYGTEGLKMQVRYILGNVSQWKGEIARESKKVMRAYIK